METTPLERGQTGRENLSIPEDLVSAAQARQVGSLEAEVADLRLRIKESLEREKRLMERADEAEEGLQKALSTEHELRIQIHRYAEFNHALRRSRPWRLIQALRRIVGREW